jgi:hypothetical protein
MLRRVALVRTDELLTMVTVTSNRITMSTSVASCY